jgi:hypothetical protein
VRQRGLPSGLAALPRPAQHNAAQVALAHERNRCIAEFARSECRRLLCRDQQHDKARMSLCEEPSGLDPATSGHTDVHQHELGRQGVGRGQGILAARGLAHNLESRRRGHEIAEHAAEELVVVDDQHRHIGAADGDGLVPFLGEVGQRILSTAARVVGRWQVELFEDRAYPRRDRPLG